MDAEAVRRAVTRIAHEVIERNAGLDEVVVVGLQTGGVPLARALADALEQIDGVTVPCGTIDVAFYRDDIGIRPVMPEAVTSIPRPRRPGGGARRRRAVHRPDHPRRARRADRLRPTEGGAAGGDDRSRAPRAAHPARLRRQEPPDATRRGGRRP